MLTFLFIQAFTEQENIQTEHNSKKQTTQNTAKQNHPGLVASYDTRPGNETGLFYNAPEPTQDNKCYQTFKCTAKNTGLECKQVTDLIH